MPFLSFGLLFYIKSHFELAVDDVATLLPNVNKFHPTLKNLTMYSEVGERVVVVVWWGGGGGGGGGKERLENTETLIVKSKWI